MHKRTVKCIHKPLTIRNLINSIKWTRWKKESNFKEQKDVFSYNWKYYNIILYRIKLASHIFNLPTIYINLVIRYGVFRICWRYVLVCDLLNRFELQIQNVCFKRISSKKMTEKLVLVADFSSLTLLLSSFDSFLVLWPFLFSFVSSFAAVAEILTHNRKMIDGEKPIFQPETVFGLLFNYRNIYVSKKGKQIEGNKIVFFYSFLCHLFIASTHPMLCCAPNWWAHAAQFKFIQFSFFFCMNARCCFSYSIFCWLYFCFFVVSFSSYVIRCSKLTIKYHFTLIFCPVWRLSLLTICFCLLQIAIENYMAL